MRSFGHILDTPDPRDHEPTFASGELPSAANLGDLACSILDQHTTSSCTQHAQAQAIYIAQGVAGVSKRILANPIPHYAIARRAKKGRDHVLCDAVDLGSAPRYGWQSLRDGIVSVEDCPIDYAKVDDEVPWDAYRKACDRQWLNFQRVTATGWERVDAIKRLLAAGHPVCFGTICDKAFQDWKGDGAWRRTGAFLGRHYLCATGYADDVFVGVNSWGPWGVNGFFAITADQIASGDIADVTFPIIDMAKL